jgi:phosphoenolpyruvate-protein kinase (PTS system EI component)
MDLSGLSAVLWRERDILENLLFRLDVQQMLLMSGRDVWLVRASTEIEEALEQVRSIELERAVRFDQAARELGVDLSPSLTELADAAEEPWKGLLNEHYEAFSDLSTRIQAVTALNRELAAAAQQATQAVMSSIHGDSEPSLNLYQAGGSTESAPKPSVFVDEGL